MQESYVGKQMSYEQHILCPKIYFLRQCLNLHICNKMHTFPQTPYFIINFDPQTFTYKIKSVKFNFIIQYDAKIKIYIC